MSSSNWVGSMNPFRSTTTTWTYAYARGKRATMRLSSRRPYYATMNANRGRRACGSKNAISLNSAGPPGWSAAILSTAPICGERWRMPVWSCRIWRSRYRGDKRPYIGPLVAPTPMVVLASAVAIRSKSLKSLPIAMANASSRCKASAGDENEILIDPGATETPAGKLTNR